MPIDAPPKEKAWWVNDHTRRAKLKSARRIWAKEKIVSADLKNWKARRLDELASGKCLQTKGSFLVVEEKDHLCSVGPNR